MRVYVTGDTHGNWLTRLNSRNFPEQKELTKDDIIIVCGDFGIWHDNNDERYKLKWLEDKSFTTCFVDGNHSNHHRLNSGEFETVDFHGGKAHKINDSLYHLMRGEIYDFGGKKFFCFGGAQSHDIKDGILYPQNFKTNKEFIKEYNKWYGELKMFRVFGVDWWPEELPSEEEMQNGIDNLENVGNKVDFVITHCLPQGIAAYFGYHGGDILVKYFQNLLDKIDFKAWYCGHYHRNNDYDRFHIMYQNIARIV